MDSWLVIDTFSPSLFLSPSLNGLDSEWLGMNHAPGGDARVFDWTCDESVMESGNRWASSTLLWLSLSLSQIMGLCAHLGLGWRRLLLNGTCVAARRGAWNTRRLVAAITTLMKLSWLLGAVRLPYSEAARDVTRSDRSLSYVVFTVGTRAAPALTFKTDGSQRVHISLHDRDCNRAKLTFTNRQTGLQGEAHTTRQPVGAR